MEPNTGETDELDAAAPIPVLPEPVLINILRLLPQHDRLTCAALACKAWAAAANGATTDIIFAKPASAAAAAGLGSWVQLYGRGVVESIKMLMQVNGAPLMLPSAALAKLAKLHLHNCSLDFDSAGQSGSAVVLPGLRWVSLNGCTVPLDTLSFLECPQLTRLELLCRPSQRSAPASSEGQLNAALSAFLQRLTGLVSLTLGHDQASDAALAQLGCLQQLQDCAIWCPCVMPEVLANLTSNLTCLNLREGRGVLQEGSLPAAGWPHLKDLNVSQRIMQPALLSRLTALESLTLFGCELWADPGMPSDDGEAGGAQLLAAMAQLTNLKKVLLVDIMLETAGAFPEPGVARQLSPFSALTVSSQLESLTLAYSGTDDFLPSFLIQPFAQGAAVWMFPRGRQLTALTELVLDAMAPGVVEQQRHSEYYDLEEDPFMDPTCMEGSDLGLLLAACPMLQRLTLNSVLPYEYEYECDELCDFLKDAKDQLQQLTYLCLGGLCLSDREARALSCMTGLRDLELHNAPVLSPEGVAHLVQLRQLTRLNLNSIGSCRCISCCVTSSSETDQPNVWQKLERELPRMRKLHHVSQTCESAQHDYDDTHAEAYEDYTRDDYTDDEWGSNWC